MFPEVISTSQSTFVPGRLINDNILIVYEMIHYLRHKREGKKGCMSLKLNMSKAHDKI